MIDRRRRVLMTADAVGGVWSYALELSLGLRRHGVDVVLAVIGRAPSPSQQRDAAAIPNLTVVHGNYRLEWMIDPWRDVDATADWLLALQRQHQPDLVHLNGYVHGDLPWEVPVVVVGHSCVVSWFASVRGSKPPPTYHMYRQRVRRGLRGADLVVAPTRAMLDMLDCYYGPLEHTAVVPNGISVRRRPPTMDGKEPFILCAGRLWDEAKNVAVLRDVAPELPWPIRLIGETTHPDHGHADLGGLVSLGLLPRSAVLEQMTRASIYAMPARYEPFGLSPLEAARCGCALVLGDIPSLREVWGAAAVFVPPHDRSAWRRALGDLIGDEHTRHRLARAASLRARRYSREDMAAAYAAAYCRLIAQRSQPASAPVPVSRRLSPPLRG